MRGGLHLRVFAALLCEALFQWCWSGHFYYSRIFFFFYHNTHLFNFFTFPAQSHIFPFVKSSFFFIFLCCALKQLGASWTQLHLNKYKSRILFCVWHHIVCSHKKTLLPVQCFKAKPKSSRKSSYYSHIIQQELGNKNCYAVYNELERLISTTCKCG